MALQGVREGRANGPRMHSGAIHRAALRSGFMKMQGEDKVVQGVAEECRRGSALGVHGRRAGGTVEPAGRKAVR